MCLVFPELRRKSYRTSKIICDKFNNLFGNRYFLELVEVENYTFDALLTDRKNGRTYTVEMKQRQNHRIQDIFSGIYFDDIYIHKVSADHNSDLFFIYDLTMHCVQIYTADKIRRDRIVIQMIRNYRIPCYIIPITDTYLVDLENGRAVCHPDLVFGRDRWERRRAYDYR